MDKGQAGDKDVANTFTLSRTYAGLPIDKHTDSHTLNSQELLWRNIRVITGVPTTR